MALNAQAQKTHGSERPARPRRWWLLAGAGLVALLLAVATVRVVGGEPPEAPEEDALRAAEARMPFQILIPAFLPREFDRSRVEITLDRPGPAGQPMAQLVYRTKQGAALLLREWVPVSPEREILPGSIPVQTRWGKGWLVAQGTGLGGLWVDVESLRVSLYSSNLDAIPLQQMVQIAYTLGPAAGRQVYSAVAEKPPQSQQPSAPSVEVPVNAQGVQEINLVVAHHGYSPSRFTVRKGVPVRLVFRQLGHVGCGNELIFPANPKKPSVISLASAQDKQVLEFTPTLGGEFEFHCPHWIYRGVMTVR